MARAQLRLCQVCHCPAAYASGVTRNVYVEHNVKEGAIIVTPHYVGCGRG